MDDPQPDVSIRDSNNNTILNPSHARALFFFLTLFLPRIVDTLCQAAFEQLYDDSYHKHTATQDIILLLIAALLIHGAERDPIESDYQAESSDGSKDRSSASATSITGGLSAEITYLSGIFFWFYLAITYFLQYKTVVIDLEFVILATMSLGRALRMAAWGGLWVHAGVWGWVHEMEQMLNLLEAIFNPIQQLRQRLPVPPGLSEPANTSPQPFSYPRRLVCRIVGLFLHVMGRCVHVPTYMNENQHLWFFRGVCTIPALFISLLFDQPALIWYLLWIAVATSTYYTYFCMAFRGGSGHSAAFMVPNIPRLAVSPYVLRDWWYLGIGLSAIKGFAILNTIMGMKLELFGSLWYEAPGLIIIATWAYGSFIVCVVMWMGLILEAGGGAAWGLVRDMLCEW